MGLMVAFAVMIVALLVVSKSADWFLRSAEKTGASLGLSPFILGMVLVGFGSALPELATSVAAVLDGAYNVALPNVIGSNMLNMLVVVGIVSFILGAIHFEKDLIDIDLPLLAATAALFAVLVADGSLTRGEAVLLLIGFVGYLLYALMYREGKEYHKGLIAAVNTLVRPSRDKGQRERVRKRIIRRAPKWSWVLTMIGSVILLAGASKLAVDNVLTVANELGLFVDVVSFFAIAIGTSLPELVVSLRAVRSGKGDIALGNVIGSSIFNLLLIAGVSGMMATQVISPPLVVWMIAGLGLAALLTTLSGVTKRIYAWEGMMFLLVYAAIGLQILSA